MAERSQLRVSEGQDGRSEPPATGRGQSRPTQGPYFALNLYAVFLGSKSASVKPLLIFTFM